MPVALFDNIVKLFNYSKQTGFDESSVLSSPWATGLGLQSIIFPDSPAGVVTEAEALRVPPVVRAIALYSTVASDRELVAAGGVTPTWMNTTYDAITPGVRLAGMVQDLIFNGRSCLLVKREDGDIVDALRMPADVWGVDSFGRITVAGAEVEDQSQFIYVSSLLPQGFLEYGAEAIKHYTALQKTVQSRTRNPIPLVELHVTEQFEGTKAELEKAQKEWAKARQSENGAVAFTPIGVELNVHQPNNTDSEMLISARNAVRLDVANFLNINAAMLDGNNGTSDTYSNTLQNKNEFTELSMATWLRPIEQRLSQNDVTPDGVRVRFNLPDFDTTTEKGNTGAAVQPADQEVTA